MDLNPLRLFEVKKTLELVQALDLRRRRANFISDEAKFAAVCGRYGENFNEVRNKICLMEPRIQNLNKL